MASMNDLLGYSPSVMNSVPLTDGSRTIEGRYAPIGMPGTPALLGQAGDFLQNLLGFGKPYKAAVDKAKLAGALSGFTEDPMGALNRVAEINPELALEAYEKLSRGSAANDIRRDNLTATIDNREDLEANRKFNRDQKSAGVIGALLAATRGNPKSYKALVPRIESYAKQVGYDLSTSPFANLPTEYDEALIPTLGALGATQGQVYSDENRDQRLPLEQKRVAIAEDALDVARTNADDGGDTSRMVAGGDGYYYRITKDGKEIKTNIKAPKKKGTALDALLEGPPTPAPTAKPKYKDGTKLYRGGKAYTVRGGKAYPDS